MAGDATPEYATLSRERVELVHDTVPDARLVQLVRNPVEQLWSRALMAHRNLGLPGTPALEEVDTPVARLHADHLSSLATWGDVFGADRLFVGFTDGIAHQPVALVNAVAGHLGLAPHDHHPQAGEQINTTFRSTMPMATAIALSSGLVSYVDRLASRLGGPARWWSFAVDSLLADPPPGDELVLPWWDSPLWDRWLASGLAGDPTALASRRLGEATT